MPKITYKIADRINGVLPEAGEHSTEKEAETALQAVINESLEEHLAKHAYGLLLITAQHNDEAHLAPSDPDFQYVRRISAAADKKEQALKCAEERIKGFYFVVEFE